MQGQADAASHQWQRRAEEAEAAARAHAEAYTTAVAELDELRERPARTHARSPRRSRPAPTPAQKPLMVDGTPVPQVPGVGAGTVLAVLQARKQHPDQTQKQLAERAGVSDRTVRAVLAAAPDRDLAVTTT